MSTNYNQEYQNQENEYQEDDEYDQGEERKTEQIETNQYKSFASVGQPEFGYQVSSQTAFYSQSEDIEEQEQNAQEVTTPLSVEVENEAQDLPGEAFNPTLQEEESEQLDYDQGLRQTAVRTIDRIASVASRITMQDVSKPEKCDE